MIIYNNIFTLIKNIKETFMKYLSDLHTHTVVSGHAYTTLMENIDYCKKNGIKIFFIYVSFFNNFKPVYF